MSTSGRSDLACAADAPARKTAIAAKRSVTPSRPVSSAPVLPKSSRGRSHKCRFTHLRFGTHARATPGWERFGTCCLRGPSKPPRAIDLRGRSIAANLRHSCHVFASCRAWPGTRVLRAFKRPGSPGTPNKACQSPWRGVSFHRRLPSGRYIGQSSNSLGMLPPFSAILFSTVLCSHMFILAESPISSAGHPSSVASSLRAS